MINEKEECLKRYPDAKVTGRVGGYCILYTAENGQKLTSIIKNSPKDTWRTFYNYILWKERNK
jgi:hypothetical protein